MTLRFREPTERSRCSCDAQRDALGYDMDIPWISRDKVHVEVSYKVTNLSATSRARSRCIVDGASEYTKYDTQSSRASAMRRRDDPMVFLPLMTTVPQTLEPGAELQRHRARGRLRRGRAGPGCARALERRRPGQPDVRGRADQPIRRQPDRHEPGPAANLVVARRCSRSTCGCKTDVAHARANISCACATTTIACCTMTPIRCTSRAPDAVPTACADVNHRGH